MTVSDYIRQKFQPFGTISEADLLDILSDAGMEANDELTSENRNEVSIAMTRFIPSLFLRPQSVSENGFSVPWDFDALKDYYLFMCKKNGIEPDAGAAGISTITDMSDLW